MKYGEFDPDCPLNGWVTTNDKHVIQSTKKKIVNNKTYWMCSFRHYCEIDTFELMNNLYDSNGYYVIGANSSTKEYIMNPNHIFCLKPPPKFPFLNWKNKYGVVKGGFLFDINPFKSSPNNIVWLAHYHVFNKHGQLSADYGILTFNLKGEPCGPIFYNVTSDQLNNCTLYSPFSRKYNSKKSRIPLIL